MTGKATYPTYAVTHAETKMYLVKYLLKLKYVRLKYLKNGPYDVSVLFLLSPGSY